MKLPTITAAVRHAIENLGREAFTIDAAIEEHSHIHAMLDLLHESLKEWVNYSRAHKTYNDNFFRQFISEATIQEILKSDRISHSNLPMLDSILTKEQQTQGSTQYKK